MWSREFKWTVVTSSHGSATWLPQGFWHKRPVLKYCLFNNKIFLMVQRGRLEWENQGLVGHWCTFGRQIQVQGQHVQSSLGPSKWYKPLTCQARVSQRSVTFIIRYYAWCSEGGYTFSQAGWRHRLQMTHLRLQVDHLVTGWWGCVGTFRGAGVAGIWHASDGGALKGGESCFGGRKVIHQEFTMVPQSIQWGATVVADVVRPSIVSDVQILLYVFDG